MSHLVLVRASRHDVTPAIPRALEASEGLFERVAILCWSRGADGLPPQENQGGVEIHRFGGTVPARSWSTVLAVARFGIWIAWHLLRRRPRYIQVCDLESAAPTAIVSLLFGGRVIYDMRDPFADSYGVGPALRRVAYALDWLVMARCTAFVVPTAERVAYLGRWGRTRSVCIVRNTCHDVLKDLDDVRAAPDSDPAVVRLAYFGYLVATRGSRELLDLCDAEQGGVELWVAGQCREAGLLEALARTPGAHWLGLLPRREALARMRDADAVLLLYDPEVPVNRIAAPNKYFEALMTGTPVIVSRGMSLAKEVEGRSLGLVVDYGNQEALRETVGKLRDPHLREYLGRHCRQYYLDHCRLELDLARYRQFYRSLVA